MSPTECEILTALLGRTIKPYPHEPEGFCYNDDEHPVDLRLEGDKLIADMLISANPREFYLSDPDFTDQFQALMREKKWYL